jgi:hypothetical protein
LASFLPFFAKCKTSVCIKHTQPSYFRIWSDL